MARGRMIAKSLSTSERYAQLHAVAGPLAEFCQAMYPLLVVHADDFGRLAGDVFTVKHVVVPTSPRSESDVAQALSCLEVVHLIQWYAVNGRKWIQIEQFDPHQPGLHKRTASLIPEPSPGNFRELPGNSGNFPVARARGTELNRTEQKYRKNAPAAPTRPKEKPKIKTLAALCREEVLPLQLADEGDRIETAKRLAAKHHLAYDSPSIVKAMLRATAQRMKGRYDS